MNRQKIVRGGKIADILEKHFGKRPAKVRRIHGGITNHVFEAKLGRDEFIVRMSEKIEKLQSFMKEQWAVRAARAANVPAPEILEVGHTESNEPYMISVKVCGEDATKWTDRLDTASRMGELAARINSIRTSGFGSVFDWSPNELSRNKSWKDFLEQELRVGERLALFASQRMLKPSSLRKLETQVRRLGRWNGQPRLTHGDIRFKNVVLDDAGKIRAILDWENCTSNIAPHWELSIALHDLNMDQKEAFLEGYGLSPKSFSKIAADLKALNVLNYAPVIQDALQKKAKDKLERLRARLHGELDLHSI